MKRFRSSGTRVAVFLEVADAGMQVKDVDNFSDEEVSLRLNEVLDAASI